MNYSLIIKFGSHSAQGTLYLQYTEKNRESILCKIHTNSLEVFKSNYPHHYLEDFFSSFCKTWKADVLDSG